MATPSEARAVKSLNNSDEIGRRFVFKKFLERIAEVNIDVYRSLEAVKAEPSEGSTFFRDCMIEYRELNTAEDFISFYEQTFPLVQTLPLIILQKDVIVTSLLSRLKMEGRLSLTPILRLLAALSRDLLDDFVPFLQRVSDSLLYLLECGAHKDPEIVEEIFTSWSYIMMYLQKYLVKDICLILRVTAKIRYYSRDYVREFMANSVSFIFRKAPIQQVKEGIRKLMLEVIDEPSDITKSGAATLLSHAVRITSSTLHSNAETLIPLLLDESSFDFSDQLEGPAIVLDVLILAFQQLYEKLDPSDCKSIWNRICLKITNCVTSENSAHLIRLLTLLIATLESDHRVNISDHQNVVELVGLLVQNFVVHYVDQHSEVIDRVLQLMLCILDGCSNSRNLSFLSGVSSHWSLVFDLRIRSLLDFIEDLLKKDLCVFNVFETNIMSALNNFVDIYEEDVVRLMLLVYEKLDGKRNKLVGENCKDFPRLHSFTEETLRYWIRMIKKAIVGEFFVTEFKRDKLAILWGVIGCYPRVADTQESQSLLMDLINAVDELLMVKSKEFAAFPEDTWHCLIGAALRSHHKLVFSRKTTHDESTMTRFLDLAKRYKYSPHVLSAVAGILDLTYGDEIEANATCQFYIPQHITGMVLEALDTFKENLSHANKEIRLSTLRILCHYEPLGNELSINHLPIEKKKSNVLYLLRSIEATPISVTSCHVSLISKMEMSLNARRVPEQYMPIVLSGLIGIFHNRFRNLWDPALKCLEVILCQYSKVLWARFFQYLAHFQSIFLTSLGQRDGNDANNDSNNTGLVKRFNSEVTPLFDSTPIATVFTLLIQLLQKVPSVVDSHSRQVVPLFLKFLGYNVDELQSAQCHKAEPKGKEWKSVLKEWLNLFRLLHNPKAFYKSQFFKDVLLYRFLDENDSDLQMKVLDCLLNWKDDFLIPYRDNLKNLVSTKYLRDEITRWSLSSNSMNAIDDRHRCDVVPIVIRVLIPKVRNMKMLGSQKNGGNHRKAVLGFLSQLDVHELPLFFSLLTKPLLPSSQGDDEVWQNLWESRSDTSSHVLEHFTVDTIKSLSWKKVCGFLHVIEDIFAVFDETRLHPFLNLLTICIVRILASCTSCLETATSNEPSSSLDNSSILDANVGENKREEEDQITERMDVKQSKDLRSLCLRIVYRVISKYEDNDFGDGFWLQFFSSVKPLIQRFKQEGASSEKPSSLFHCFLAMSKSHKLVPLLFMERNLVPDIFSILTVPSASESILSCVLKFAKNLLKLASELGSEVNSVKELLVPHLNKLMSSLHSIFAKGNGTKRKLIKSPGKKEFTIFKLLSNYVKEPLEANKFIDMLLPLLTKKTLDPDICVEALQIIQQLVALTGKDCSEIILKSVTPLLISADMGVRTIICDVLDTLAANDDSLDIVAQILGELNAIAEMEIDDLDYDKVICAYNKINVNFFNSIPEEQALVILSHCIYDMSSKVLRQSALGVLRSFIEFSAMILDGSPKSGHFWSESNIRHVVKNFLLKHMGDAMDKELPVLQVWFEVLKDMVLKIPNVANLGSYKPLCSDDPEQDFFSNLFHLQKHLRARALLRFKNVMGSGEQSEVVSNKVFVPLLFRLLFELQDGKDEHIRTACMQALSFLSSNMSWNQYYALLNRCFRDLKLKAGKQKILLRLICSIFDHYHFSEASADNKSSTHEEHDPYFINVASPSTLKRNADSVELSIIQMRLQKNVLPKIQNLFVSDPDKINVYASIVALKILKLLPADIMDSQLPTIVHRISNFLKNRLESVRDEARHALAACMTELGLEYLQFVVKVLRSTLKRGYELHVLGFTLNFILLKFLKSPICGKLDYCLEDLLSVVENDILVVSDEKDVDKIASKMKETRKQKSFETLKVIAQSVTFKTHGLKLLSIVTNNLCKQLNQKVKSKFENMLANIAAGIESNPSVDRTELFVFVYGLIADGISDEVDDHALENDETPPNRLLNVDQRYSHLITTFSLGVMHNYMKNMKLNKEDEQLLSLLDPFVKRLCQCLSSKYESVITGALRCLCLIIRLPLPSLQSQADRIKESLLIITQGSINSNQLTESCVKLLTTLLRSTRVTLSSDQLHMLIQFPLFVDLANNPSGVALSLLKAIVHRKLVVPEIYDIVQIVAELMIQSQVEQFRKKCSKIFLQFLLGYHISDKRLQQHLDMLLANLRYEHSTGRESVLEMLHAIIKKFPRNIVDAHSQTMFVHLVVSLANDEDSKVRSMTIVALKCLISHVNVNLLHSILEYCQLWYFGKKQNLWGAAAQVLGLLVEVMGNGFTKHLKSVLQAMRSILQSAASAFRPEQQNLSDEVVVPLWKEAYYSLVMFEKILNQFNNLFFDKDLEDIWEIICQFLLHPRSWLRNISNSLLSQYYSSVTNACRENQEQSLQKFMLMKPSKLFLVSVSLCCQLKVPLIEEAVQTLLSQNLVFAICSLHSVLEKSEVSDAAAYWSALEPTEQDVFVKAFVVLDPKKGRRALTYRTSEQGHHVQRQHPFVTYMLQRMGKMCFEMEASQMKVVFDCLKIISPRLLHRSITLSPVSDRDPNSYAYQILLPLYRVQEGYTGSVVTDDLKLVAQKVSESIRDIIGVPNFVQIYHDLSKNLKQKRDKRKQEVQIMAVVNPERNAKRKLRIAAKHSANKKRKFTSMKMGRWMR